MLIMLLLLFCLIAVVQSGSLVVSACGTMKLSSNYVSYFFPPSFMIIMRVSEGLIILFIIL